MVVIRVIFLLLILTHFTGTSDSHQGEETIKVMHIRQNKFKHNNDYMRDDKASRSYIHE